MSHLNLLALNPNSSECVTESVVRAMRQAVQAHSVTVRGMTCTDAPAGIVTQSEYADAECRMAQRAQQGFADTHAVIIACFSDPGLDVVRAAMTIPVLGLGAAGMQAACQLGQRIGVIAVADAAIPRHIAYWQRLGVSHRVVSERALNLSVAASGDPDLAFDRMLLAAQQLRDNDAAEVILLGCAGMASLRASLSESVGLPVVDPCAAAALAAVQACGHTISPRSGS